jgi:CubicO group peptidase (beta-lactamase class C family)
MAASAQRSVDASFILISVCAAAVIAAPGLVARRAPPFTTVSTPLPDTQPVVAPSTPGPPGGIRPGALEALPSLMDREAARLMAEQHAPGAAVVVVQAGRVVVERAYGVGDVERGTLVDAARTLFRVGSVTKPLTAAALLGLVDDGRLDLHRDIGEYLPELRLRFAVTAHQLLTHTAGFDEKFAGGFTLSPDHLQPLGVYLPRFAHQAVRPGLFYSYGSTNYAVAGWLLERLTGVPYEDAMATRLFTPLRMRATTARQPPEDRVAARRVHGYAWEDGRYRALPFRYTQTAPAGAVSTTAADMGRFMRAVLGDGVLDGMRVLSSTSRAALLRPQFRDHPRLFGVTYGFREWRTHGRVLLHHDGTLDDQVGVILLDPDNQFGFFAASNSNPGIGNHLLEPILTHVYGPSPDVPTPRAMPGPSHAAEVAGVYLDFDHTRHDLSSVRAIMPMLQSRVVAEGDGISWAGRRWTEVAPFVFEAPGAVARLVFRQADGRVIAMQTWPSSYERIGVARQTPVHLGFLAACVLVFLMAAASMGVSRRGWAEGRWVRALALSIALSNLAFVAWFVASLRSLGSITPLPALDMAFLTLGLATAVAAALLPGCALAVWRHRWWTGGTRVAFTALAVSAVAFAGWLNAWNLLGFQF